ncbi:LysE family translocator [Rhodophyticola sp. CCM32]|uniref:LysE family translocator n=1 Tax=Rhodophyticola sp. CCM32 TaxID=2916397 RepID=UPI001EE5C782|nr:LysE family translocator [Rhodophyticola sp. CCM32]
MIAEHLPGLFLALGIFSMGFLVLGPNILAVMGTSMARGRAQGAALAIGIGLGSGLWATMTVAGLATLITAYAGAMVVLKLFGAAYLLWLAIKAFRSAARPDQADLSPQETDGCNMVLRGLTIQMTNPKAALQWIAIVSIGLGAGAPWQIGALLVISATALSLLGHLAYAVAFSTGPVIAIYALARRGIEVTLGVMFTFAAFKLTTSRS